MKCRHCQTELQDTFVDLGFAPASNAYLPPEALARPEIAYPLRVLVCRSCWLVQTEDYAHCDALFDADYAYFSSTSKTWLSHAADYVEKTVKRLQLGAQSKVVELASNDGYLLQYVQQRNIPCLGIEPTHGTANAARAKGIRVVEEFFGTALAQTLQQQGEIADLIIANNVLAHVPDINDFIGGMRVLLADEGTITIEFPHLLNLIRLAQFDTIYHEHFSYLALGSVDRMMRAQGLRVYDVEELTTHGGSLRVYVCHRESAHAVQDAVGQLLAAEHAFGLEDIAVYRGFQERATAIKIALLEFLVKQKRDGKTVAAYGAAAKGNTLLNYSGIDADLLPLVADAAASKQGKYLPGSHIPVVSPEQLMAARPDYVLILPWNLKEEVEAQLVGIREWNGLFVTAVPELRVW
jgi:2-polyprenyl-3-methyl-5-hydroxy-6-metoxy-1,4-benzoquinol methylase